MQNAAMMKERMNYARKIEGGAGSKEMFAAELNGGEGRKIGNENRRKKRASKRVYLSQHSQCLF